MYATPYGLLWLGTTKGRKSNRKRTQPVQRPMMPIGNMMKTKQCPLINLNFLMKHHAPKLPDPIPLSPRCPGINVHQFILAFFFVSPFP